MELWLENYLGLFFNFKHFGNLNWLAIPLLIYFLITIKKRKRWEMAILFVFFLSCLSLGIKGHGYPRYLFTLYPFTLTLIFLFGWELIRKKSRYIQIGILIVCSIVVFFNYYHFRDAYKFFWSTRVSLSDDRFPHKTIEIINNIQDSNSVFLICSHRYLFFYHTNKKGIHYRDPRLRIFYSQGNKEAALDVLKNQLKVKYILVHWTFKRRMIRTLQNIITEDCDLIIKNKGLQLYRIRGTDDK